MEFGAKELSQILALSLKEYGNSINLKASAVTLGILKLLETYIKCPKWRCGSSVTPHKYLSMDLAFGTSLT